MIKQIFNKNIIDLVRNSAFGVFVALQLLLFVFVVFDQVPHIMFGYIFKFYVVLIYLFSAYLAAKFMFDLKKTNAFAFVFMKPISKSFFTISSISSILFAMLVPICILLLSVFIANKHMDSDMKFKSNIILESDKTLIREIAKELQTYKKNQSFDEVYKEVLLYKATVFPNKTGVWTFNVPSTLNKKSFSVVYNTFFNTLNRDNTNSLWNVSIDSELVLIEPYVPDSLPSGVLKPLTKKSFKVITVEFINNSASPVMFVPKEPVNIVFNGGHFNINLLKGGIKVLLNVLLIVSFSFMLSISMSVPGVFFSAYLSIISCMLYKLFYINKSSGILKEMFFGNGFNEMLNSQCLQWNQLFFFALIISVFVLLVTKISEYQLKQDNFYLDHK